ncbi:MAG: signal peptidase I [Planctomycetota bacterium]
MRRFFLETLTVCALATLLALALHFFVTQVYAISGQSMEPTLHDGDRVVIHKLSPGLLPVEVGDLVIFTSPNDGNKNLVKRVIAVGGDRVRFDREQVWVNDKPIRESYILRGLYSEGRDEILVEDGDIFVLGDNRPQSQDSRHFNPIPLESVKGKVFLRLWPLDMISTFP